MHELAQQEPLRLNAGAVDYVLLALYFAFVLGIGYLARRSVSTSLDFFLSGRSLPAWVTGLAFVSANLGAVEVMGMSANGAEYGMPTMHYFWIGAVPAMLFLAIVMMPFYYGSKVRSVPEFMLRRFDKPTHLVNAISFAVAQVLIAGLNLYLLASIVNALLGWPLWVSVIAAGAIVLSYTALGGLTAAVYNEVLQFFVIVAALLPLTIVGLNKVGGWNGLVDKVASAPGGGVEQLSAWPASDLTGISNGVLSSMGVVFGLGFVLSFGYWTTNFVEVQRAMASKSMAAARRAPVIGAVAKMLIPFIVVIPGMVAGVATKEIAQYKATEQGSIDYNDALLVLMRDLLPNGMLGVALAGLLASFMAGMAANLSAFSTVFTYDIWQSYIRPGRPDEYYLSMGRRVIIVSTVLSMGTAFIAAGYSNLMDYLQQLFSIFNAPLFATFILGLFWKRMTPTAGWLGLACGMVSSAVMFGVGELLDLPGQGGSFLGAGTAFVVDVVVSVVATMLTRPKPEAELRGLVYSLTPKEDRQHAATGEDAGWYRSPAVLAGGVLVVIVLLNIAFG
jgi:SSS family solute:Na+ symporter